MSINISSYLTYIYVSFVYAKSKLLNGLFKIV